MLKISTEIGSVAKVTGREKALEYVARAGFDAYDLTLVSMVQYNWETGVATVTEDAFNGDNYLEYARKLKAFGEGLGLHCNQTHAPFPVANSTVRGYLERSIEITAEMGAKICVIHPDNNKSPLENAEFYNSLLPFAKEKGVKIAAENMWNWNPNTRQACFAACSDEASFCAHLEAGKDKSLVACLDIGHAEMQGLNTSACSMIYALKDNLQALHLHDNDLKNDCHALLFSMDIDFEKIAKALADINYNGYLTLECDSAIRKYTKETAFDCVYAMAEGAKTFAQLVENFKR